MADQDTRQQGGNGTTGEAGGQGNQNLPSLTVSVQYVKDLSFENPRAPQSLGDLNPPPEINVDVNVEMRGLQPNVYEAVLNIRAKAARGEATFFIVELSYAGIFIVGNVPEQRVQALVTIEGPRMLFPFARAIIANAVRDGGFPPLLINPIDFHRLYQQTAEARSETATA